jgi:hypothetical protein
LTTKKGDAHMFFDYEKMVQDKFKEMVFDVLKHVEKEGLPSNHHFFITFATNHPRLVLPDYLVEENPEEMTIVVQHQFWELEVDSKGFSIVLSFDGSSHNIYIPFDSLIAFVDPYADFGLEFSPVLSNDNYEDKDDSPDDDDTTPKGNVVTIDFSKKK